jgi:KUP system potassium uptake protein
MAMSSGRSNQEIVPYSGDLEVQVQPVDVQRQDSLYLDATRPAHGGHHAGRVSIHI